MQAVHSLQRCPPVGIAAALLQNVPRAQHAPVPGQVPAAAAACGAIALERFPRQARGAPAHNLASAGSTGRLTSSAVPGKGIGVLGLKLPARGFHCTPGEVLSSQ